MARGSLGPAPPLRLVPRLAGPTPGGGATASTERLEDTAAAERRRPWRAAARLHTTLSPGAGPWREMSELQRELASSWTGSASKEAEAEATERREWIGTAVERSREIGRSRGERIK
nr:unnamed protein product [Digitaria exilis]